MSVAEVEVGAEIKGRATSPAEEAEINAARAVASQAKNIPTGLIEVSEIKLRGVDTDGEEFLNLAQSIRTKGVLNSILVRAEPLGDGLMKYHLIDGLQRFTAAKALGLAYIPANVVSADDDEALIMQIVTNTCRVQTKPAEYAQHLYRILSRSPLETKDSLAKKLSVARSWIDSHLQLTKLTPAAAELVDQGKIKLNNAFVLAKLPAEEQPAWIDAAQNEPTETFGPRAKARAKELKDAASKGKDAEQAEWQPTPHLRRVGDLKEELAAIVTGEGESGLLAELETGGFKIEREAIQHIMKWLFNVHPAGVQKQEEEHKARVAKAEAAKAKRKQEQEEAKAKAAAAKAADPFAPV